MLGVTPNKFCVEIFGLFCETLLLIYASNDFPEILSLYVYFLSRLVHTPQPILPFFTLFLNLNFPTSFGLNDSILASFKFENNGTLAYNLDCLI